MKNVTVVIDPELGWDCIIGLFESKTAYEQAVERGEYNPTDAWIVIPTTYDVVIEKVKPRKSSYEIDEAHDSSVVPFCDMYGKPIYNGSILKYDEGPEGSWSVDIVHIGGDSLVEDHDYGEEEVWYGRTIAWGDFNNRLMIEPESNEIVPLKHYSSIGTKSVCDYTEVIGNIETDSHIIDEDYIRNNIFPHKLL